MVSFMRAVELGVDGIEFDVHRTVDGHLVVMHDAMVDRTTDGTGLIMTMTLDQIKALDAGIKKGPQFKGERVPTLREVITAMPANVRLYIELKAGSIHYPGIEEQLVALLEEEGALGRVQVSSFDHHALRRLHDLRPDLPLGMLFTANLIDPVGQAQALGCEALHPTWEWVTAEFVQAAHAGGLKVNAWNVNYPFAIARLEAFGVDGIISDFPDRI